MLRKYKPFLKAGMMNAFAYKGAIYTWLFISILHYSGEFIHEDHVGVCYEYPMRI